MPAWLLIVLFQINWWVCVLGAARGHAFIGAITVVATGIAHAAWFPRRKKFRLSADAATSLTAGLIVDSVLMALGVIRFPINPIAPFPAAFMLALWVNFGLTLGLIADWLGSRLLIAALLGLVGGPLAYWGGEQLGALELHNNRRFAVTAVALAWAMATPVLIQFAKKTR